MATTSGLAKAFRDYRNVLMLLLTVGIPFCVTLYAYIVTTHNETAVMQAKFDSLAKESEKALLYRMDSYSQALKGAKGFFEGSSNVDRGEWKSYVDAIDVLESYHGINGLGTVYDVPQDKLNAFEQEAKKDGYPDFSLHPEGNFPENFIIKYIEPVDINREAVGLNIGFEENRREAARLARDSGRPAITKRILLVQDTEKTPGFLLLLPRYKKGMPITTVDERRFAFDHWIYAPFIGKNFMHNLTRSQGKKFELKVYDGEKQSSETLIYNSKKTINDTHQPRFTLEKKVRIMQQDWLLVWTSTSEFERLEGSNEPLLILAVGLTFTVLLGVFVTILMVQASEITAMTWRHYMLPAIAFFLFVAVSIFLYREMLAREQLLLKQLTDRAANTISTSIKDKVNSRVLALGRMADRWITRKGTPYEEWKRDARFYTNDQPGLKTVEWVDNTYHVRWVEPEAGNENAKGLDILFDDARKQALEGAVERHTYTLTPPLDLVQGYKGFIAYFPLNWDNKFNGFIVGLFDIAKLFDVSVSGGLKDDFVIALTYGGEEFLGMEMMRLIIRNFPAVELFWWVIRNGL